MKKYRKLIITITILIVLIGGISLLIANIMKDKKETNKNIEVIKYNYNELSKNVEEYNEIRRELSVKLNDFMYDKYSKEKEGYEEILIKYNSNITKIDNNIKNIDKRCKNIYKDKEVNNICKTYKTNYEKIVNIYINDLTNYNNKVTSYNEYKNENNSLFELIHTNYIDYNNDNVYEGRSNNEGKQN